MTVTLDQGQEAFEAMVALKDIGVEGTPIEVTEITIAVKISTLAVEASRTTTHVLHLSTGLMVGVTMTFHNREGPNRLAMDGHTMMS